MGKILINAIINKEDLDFEDEEGYSILMLATGFNNYEIVKLMIDRGADININHSLVQMHPFSVAIENENIDMIKLFLKNNVNINFQDEYKQSFLHYAVSMSKNKEIINILIKNNINPELIDNDGKTATAILFEHYPTDERINILSEYRNKINSDIESSLSKKYLVTLIVEKVENLSKDKLRELNKFIDKN